MFFLCSPISKCALVYWCIKFPFGQLITNGERILFPPHPLTERQLIILTKRRPLSLSQKRSTSLISLNHVNSCIPHPSLLFLFFHSLRSTDHIANKMTSQPLNHVWNPSQHRPPSVQENAMHKITTKFHQAS